MLMLGKRSLSKSELQDAMETFMDETSSPVRVLELVAEICYGKAEHLRGNWQDEARGKLWERWGNVIGRAGSRLDNPYR